MQLDTNYNLAIIIPYRDRFHHLSIFLPHMERFLSKTLRNKYSFYFIEQLGWKDFNRGKLKNAGFALAQEENNYFCFHDIDMLPISKSCDYSFASEPTHLAKYIEQYQWVPLEGDKRYFGGVVLFSAEVFLKINGYYNDFWGWGCEDDDLLDRCNFNGFKIVSRHGMYKSLSHKSESDFVSVNGKMEWVGQSKNVKENRYKYHKMNSLNYIENGLNSLEFKFRNRVELSQNACIYQIEI